ncbi:MAG: hypothetical protein MUF58_01390 [Arcicella sp.]|jgi:hypothetical protein|nr:hypothetical protein [Arcicella sp.]
MKQLMSIWLFLLAFHCYTQTLYVSGALGKDSNIGTKELPIKTLSEAAKRGNLDTTEIETTIILLEGVHIITETALFNNLKYTETNRLTIRAEILPDDTNWHPQQMPTVLTAAQMLKDENGEKAIGIQIETNHATIQGIRFTGSVDYPVKSETQIRRSYPIWREGLDLNDLMVSQCVFIGNSDVMPLHVGVIANGHGLVLEHCVFFNCKNPVVFWKAKGNSKGNAMINCLVYGSTFSGIWTVETDGDDFEFRNNIITNSKVAWIRERNGTRNYWLNNCIISNNMVMSGYAGGAVTGLTETKSDFMNMKNVQTSGTILLEMNPIKRNYLHIQTGAFGSDLKAGLFR